MKINGVLLVTVRWLMVKILTVSGIDENIEGGLSYPDGGDTQ